MTDKSFREHIGWIYQLRQPMQEWTRAKLHTCWLMSQRDRLLELRPIPPISSWSLKPKAETIRHTPSCAAGIPNKFFGRFYGLLATLQMLKTRCRKPY